MCCFNVHGLWSADIVLSVVAFCLSTYPILCFYLSLPFSSGEEVMCSTIPLYLFPSHLMFHILSSTGDLDVGWPPRSACDFSMVCNPRGQSADVDGHGTDKVCHMVRMPWDMDKCTRISMIGNNGLLNLQIFFPFVFSSSSLVSIYSVRPIAPSPLSVSMNDLRLKTRRLKNGAMEVD